MRLTAILFREQKGRLFEQKWQKKSQYKPPPLVMSKAVQDSETIHVVDPLARMEEREKWAPPVPDDPRWTKFFPVDPEKNPNHQQSSAYMFDTKTRLLEGLKQASALTKTVVREGLPESLTSRLGNDQLPNQDELVQRCIMQANKWDSADDKLPRRFNPQLPGWKFKVEHGIRKSDQIRILLNNLIRLSTMYGQRSEKLLSNRRMSRLHHCYTNFVYKDKPIYIDALCDWVLSGEKPLAPFAGQDSTDATIMEKVADIFPVSPTIDLIPSNIYQLGHNDIGWTNFKFSHPFTLYLGADDFWKTDQQLARALIVCHGYAVSQAISRFGVGSQVLPEPISVQCVHTNGSLFHFVCYQLNTMNLQSESGVKNMAWIDKDNLMYEKIEPRRAMLKWTEYENYNHTVFEKMLAMWTGN